MIKFLKNLQFIFRPDFWTMIAPYNKQWDKDLNYLIDNCMCELDQPNSLNGDYYILKFKPSTDITIGVWVKNYPYSYGKPHTPHERGYRPSKLTILKLRKLENKLKGN